MEGYDQTGRRLLQGWISSDWVRAQRDAGGTIAGEKRKQKVEEGETAREGTFAGRGVFVLYSTYCASEGYNPVQKTMFSSSSVRSSRYCSFRTLPRTGSADLHPSRASNEPRSHRMALGAVRSALGGEPTH